MGGRAVSNPPILIPGPLPAMGEVVTFTVGGVELTGEVYRGGTRSGYVAVLVGDVKKLAGGVKEYTHAKEYILREAKDK